MIEAVTGLDNEVIIGVFTSGCGVPPVAFVTSALYDAAHIRADICALTGLIQFVVGFCGTICKDCIVDLFYRQRSAAAQPEGFFQLGHLRFV